MRRALLALIFLLLTLFVVSPARTEDAKELHVVIISIDGLRPEFYSGEGFDTPVLRALAAAGAQARGVEAVYPSSTYPGHASIVTGVRPAKHRIVANQVWSETGARPEWFWETKDLAARTLWQAAHEKGKKVAITQWPTTVGARVDWLVPERWGLTGESTRDLLLKHSTPGILIELAIALGVDQLEPDIKDQVKLDEFVSKAAGYVLERHKPDLLLVHLTQVDHEEHLHGRDAAEVKAAVHRQDANVGRIREAAKKGGILESTVFVIVGDHGFTDCTRTISPNVALVEAGLVDLKEKNVAGWRALGHAHGGSMTIYAKDEASSKKARAVLEKEAVQQGKRLYSIVDRKELDDLGANADAAFWLEAEDQVAFWGSVDGPLVSEHVTHGTHGGLPTKKQLHTGFIASGPGIRTTTIEKMRLIDIAPTLAKLMDVSLPDAEGGVLDILAGAEPD